MEFGELGGALWMNAGAYGHEIGTVTETVRVAREGRVVEVPGNTVQWNYRHTSFKDGELLLGATLRLTPDDAAQSWRAWKTQRAAHLLLNRTAGVQPVVSLRIRRPAPSARAR